MLRSFIIETRVGLPGYLYVRVDDPETRDKAKAIVERSANALHTELNTLYGMNTPMETTYYSDTLRGPSEVAPDDDDDFFSKVGWRVAPDGAAS